MSLGTRRVDGPTPESDAGSAHTGLIGRLLRGLPTALVVAGLAGAAYWGHRTGWTLPKFSALTGAAAEPDDWCAAHGVPESICVECRQGLMAPEPDFGWCKVHGVPNCPWEHPEVAQVEGRLAVAPADRQRAERALAFAPRTENNSKCKLHQRRIQFASAEAVEKAGIEVEPVERGAVIEAVTANGEVTYDQTRVARLSARAPGTVWRVYKQAGDPVAAGEVLALVDAAEVGRAKSEFLQALTQADLKARTLDGLRAAYGAVAERTVREAEAALREAEIHVATAEQALVNLGLPVRAEEIRGMPAQELTLRLRFLGLPDPLVAGLDPRATTGNLLPILSPLSGVVLGREVVAGEVVDTARPLLVVGDTSRMWLTLNVRLEDARKVKVGQPVRFRPSASDEDVTGIVAWVGTAADEKTRTLKVRADLANTDGRLAANTFGTGHVILREEDAAVVVPNEAVQWEGDCSVVFVRDKNFLKDGAPKVFHTRKIQPGARDDTHTEVIAGLLPGEVVVTRGSGTLRGELLKNNLGEG